MDLRDYFAGQALAGILAGGFADTVPHDDANGGRDAAFLAYQYADAMLAARDKKPWYPDDKVGWVEWAGGKNPVPGCRVEYLRRMEREREGYYVDYSCESEHLDWEHSGVGGDIVAYRVCNAE